MRKLRLMPRTTIGKAAMLGAGVSLFLGSVDILFRIFAQGSLAEAVWSVLHLFLLPVWPAALLFSFLLAGKPGWSDLSALAVATICNVIIYAAFAFLREGRSGWTDKGKS